MLDTLYQLCPPLFAMGMMRLDSPSSHNRDIYAQDKAFFLLHKNRSLYLRQSYNGEFDFEMSIQDSMKIPRLQILVTKLATGIHQVSPVYRGKSFFYGNDTSDIEILEIVMEMSRRGGIDVTEWATFASHYNNSIKLLEVTQ
jgi:hypothetical protein